MPTPPRLLFFAAIALALPTLARGQTKPTPPAAVVISDRQRIETLLSALPKKSIDSLNQVIAFRWQGAQLVASSQLPDLKSPVRLILPNETGPISFTPINGDPNAAAPNAPREFMLMQHAFSPDGQTDTITNIAMAGGQLTIARASESNAMLVNVQLLIAPAPMGGDPAARLYVQVENKTANRSDVNLRLGGRTFRALYYQHPAEVDQYVRPMIRAFGQEQMVFAPDPRAAWQVLGAQFEPNPATVEKVNALVAKLDAEDFQERSRALASLKALGEPAALILMHADRAGMSAEKQTNIDALLDSFSPLSAGEARTLRDSRPFLIDVLGCDDPALARLAWMRLQIVSPTTMPATMSTTAPFDPNAPIEQRRAFAQQLQSAADPTTQPAP